MGVLAGLFLFTLYWIVKGANGSQISTIPLPILLVLWLLAVTNEIGGRLKGLQTTIGRVTSHDRLQRGKSTFWITQFSTLEQNEIENDKIFNGTTTNDCCEIVYFRTLLTSSLRICKFTKLDDALCEEPSLSDFAAKLNQWIKQDIAIDDLKRVQPPSQKFDISPPNPKIIIFEYLTITAKYSEDDPRRVALPDTHELIKQLKTAGYASIVVSSKSQITSMQKMINRQLIDDLVVHFIDTTDKYSNVLRYALELFNLEPHECIVVTNSPNTRELAERYGVSVYWLDERNNPEQAVKHLRAYLSSALGKNL